MKTKLCLIFLASATAGTLLANAATISFASLSQPGSGLVFEGGSVGADGFTFTSQDGALDVWGASSPNLPSLSTADTSLFEFYAGSTTTLTDAGSPFSVSSIDLAPLIAGGSGTFTVEFIGTYADSSTVSQMFTVDDTNPTVLTTFDLSNFTNLVSLEFTQGTNVGFFEEQDSAYQFDNVVVNAGTVGTPEPGSLVWLGAAFALLLAATARRAKAGSAVRA
jgi:hypothetical protein